MRNLKLLKSRHSSELRGPGSPQCLSVRVDPGTVLIASQHSIAEFNPHTGQVVSEGSLTADGYLPADGSGCVVGLQDLAEVESACLATAGGDVVIFDLNTGQLECVGSVDSGLTAMSWSPDEELVVFTTGQETVIMMTKSFEPITEFAIHQDGFGEGKFITVGWGKKETQFHGSEGKEAAQKKAQNVKPAAEWDDRRPRVTWRGDGQLFAVGAICPQTGARKVRVWNREGVLQATSEPVDGLEQALSWKPSGSLMASTQRHPNKQSVVFMEKNGLLHGDFTLPLRKDQAKVKELLWSNDSKVLAVWFEDLTGGQDGRVNTCVQLWTVGNYHWYLKQSLDFGTDPSQAPACICWDPEQPLRLHLVTRGWTYLAYDWGWTTERSQRTDALDNANVAVIDGDKILVTCFRQNIVPPPMCSFELQLSSPVNQVTFLCQPQRTNQLAALTANGSIAVYHQDSGGEPDKGANGFRTVTRPLVLQKTLSVAFPQEVPLSLRHLLWLQDDLFVAVGSGPVPTSSALLVLRPSQDSDALSVRYRLEVDGVVIGLVCCCSTRSLALQLEDGRIRKITFSVDCAELSLEEWRDSSGCLVNFPTPCPQMALCSVDGQACVLGLTDRSHLFAADVELSPNVSSFAVCDDFLVVTTHSHTCRCLRLSALGPTGLQAALAQDGGQNDETLRRVERGSRVVTVVPQDMRVVLQMPRGNLEAVHHRALVLAQLRQWLDDLRFGEAFECMRKLRINLNLLYDHNPKAFLENTSTFLTQLDSINSINLFLTELREEDTTSSMYPRPEGRPQPSQRPPVSGCKKVDLVCDALRGVMEATDPNKFFLSILTAHVKKTTPELEIALQKVHTLRVNPPDGDGGVNAEEALKYLLFLVNVNDLYDHSLGTYDFDLVLMVAEKSQKDPKEYLPFLNMLKGLETHYQRYTIDKHLKRYGKALVHLSKSGEEHFPEVLQLVKEQKLYAQALRLYPADGAHYKALSRAYAKHLLWRCGELDGALQAFVAATSWRNAVCVAQQIQMADDQLALLARELAGKLNEQRRYTEAAVLLDQYAKDCEEAILALISGGAWEEALRLIHAHDRADITETDLKPALVEAASTQTFLVETQAAAFARHRTRLAVVRQRKEDKARSNVAEDDGPDCADAELYSEASGVVSASKYSQSNSRVSSRSSKNRRKAERKKLSLKEGNPAEEQALTYALGEIVTSVDKTRGERSLASARGAGVTFADVGRCFSAEEVAALLKALALFRLDKQAEELQGVFDDALRAMEGAVPEVWPRGTPSSRAPMTGPNSTANSITASFQQQTAPMSQQDIEISTPPTMRSAVKWKLDLLN
ncbi:elongator complex protein 1 isoform X2 [Syngnathoides biaculeatus]|uniref:elongator complex protein 1 isoform X2 n=1 Tax=Syngnathoides biaculeatus TaxID=300417 RepID=UPI002ADDF404|nr:elongator complex protein 1 isoform X2 [Syngnathoides biaculeatus]